MTQQQWEAIERTLDGMSAAEKLQVADRIRQSVSSESVAAVRAGQQGDALKQLCRKVDAMPSARPGDGLSNRDHDAILYAR